jgi:hypothetical protein
MPAIGRELPFQHGINFPMKSRAKNARVSAPEDTFRKRSKPPFTTAGNGPIWPIAGQQVIGTGIPPVAAGTSGSSPGHRHRVIVAAVELFAG